MKQKFYIQRILNDINGQDGIFLVMKKPNIILNSKNIITFRY